MALLGSLEHYTENGEEDTGFTSIPQGMWWAVQTLTSLGYGDFWPHTVLGKTVGSMCAVCGVLVMALPIPIVVDNFADYYSEQKKLEAKELKKEAQTKQASIDADAEEIANRALIKTLSAEPGAFNNPPCPRIKDYRKSKKMELPISSFNCNNVNHIYSTMYA
jgi:hypothetical protein